ncbi:FBP domain-containing protein [Streptomyces sp. GC420]|uniref:FBP domain-containing protein n=1 Tax=Streptomyces sp. GC420 TaxID=2697568 RepID=UPI001414D00C|nr:FBP domain-containing protein [Streptomyces sp. GC420]NBM15594.1 FBP domain-containing protein [Streptomyces sp. GC420]
MEPLGDKQIRGSFVNCTKGEASRLPLPRGLNELPWDDLDFLGWRDPGAPDRSYLVTGTRDGLVGVALRFPAGRRSILKQSICSLCLTVHGANGVSLLTARLAGAAGRQGHSVGAYMCTDLACPLYIRGKKRPDSGGRFEETLTQEEQIARTGRNLDAFLAKVFAQPAG